MQALDYWTAGRAYLTSRSALQSLAYFDLNSISLETQEKVGLIGVVACLGFCYNSYSFFLCVCCVSDPGAHELLVCNSVTLLTAVCDMHCNSFVVF